MHTHFILLFIWNFWKKKLQSDIERAWDVCKNCKYEKSKTDQLIDPYYLQEFWFSYFLLSTTPYQNTLLLWGKTEVIIHFICKPLRENEGGNPKHSFENVLNPH